MAKPAKLGTRAVWAGEEEYLLQGATQVPVVHSVSFGYRDNVIFTEFLPRFKIAVTLCDTTDHNQIEDTSDLISDLDQALKPFI